MIKASMKWEKITIIRVYAHSAEATKLYKTNIIGYKRGHGLQY
jgi:hypothetical protein